MTWRAFDLHPEIPAGGLSAERLFGAGGAMEERFDLLEGLLADAGLPLRRPERIPRTRFALEASEWIRETEPGVFPAFHRSVFLAYWAEGRDIGEPDVVVELAMAAGADGRSLATVLEAGTAGAAVDRSTAEAVEAGVTGTPAWLFPGGFIVPGAQPRDVLDRVVTRVRERGLG